MIHLNYERQRFRRFNPQLSGNASDEVYFAPFGGDELQPFEIAGYEPVSTQLGESFYDTPKQPDVRFKDGFHTKWTSYTGNEVTPTREGAIAFAKLANPLEGCYDVTMDQIITALFRQVPLASRFDIPTIGSLHRAVERVGEDPSDEIMTMEGPFDSDFSIWFLLVDLVTIPSVVGQIVNQLHGIRRVKDSAQAVKFLINGQLINAFAALPLIADIKSFLDTIARFRDKIKLMERSTIERWHRHRDFTNPLMEPIVRRIHMSGVGKLELRITPRREFNRLGRNMRYCFRTPELNAWVARLAQFLDAFGVIDPAAIWDVVPWSFVVDWFYSIGAWLRHNKPKAYKLEVEMLEYCETFTGFTEFDVHLDAMWFPDLTAVPLLQSSMVPERRFIGRLTHSHMLRLVGKPKGKITFDARLKPGSGLNSTRVYLSSLLAGQRIIR
jgi:hypothetical protein